MQPNLFTVAGIEQAKESPSGWETPARMEQAGQLNAAPLSEIQTYLFLDQFPNWVFSLRKRNYRRPTGSVKGKVY